MKKYLSFVCLFVFLVLSSCTITTPSTNVKHGLEFKDQEFSYDGEAHSIFVEGKNIDDYKIEYVGNDVSQIGIHEVTAEIYQGNETKPLDSLTANIIIKGKLESQEFIYDGESHSLSLNGEVKEGFNVIYSNNNQVEVGKYYVEAKLEKQSDKTIVDTYYAIMEIDYPKNEEFEAYMDEFLIALLEGDQRSINFLFKNPENYGLEHYEALLPTYSNDYSYEEGQAELKVLIDELSEFSNKNLNKEQEETLEIVSRYLGYLYSFTENMNYMTNSYLGSYLGYQCNLPLELAEYKFRNEQDVIDFISYLNHSEEAFKTYVEFTKDQIKYGYPMADNVIENIISSSKEFIKMGESNFLISIFAEKLDNVSFELLENTKEAYNEQVKTAVLGPLTNAYQYLVDNLPALKGNCSNPVGLAGYGEEGVQNYLLEMSNVLGFEEIDGEELFEFLEDKYNRLNGQINDVVREANKLNSKDYNKFYSAVVLGTPNFADLTFEGIVSYFKNKSLEFVPELSEMPNITIKNVPDALTESFSPAAYFVSAIDETKEEVIYLNQAYTNDYNYIFTTLAHEGYPGHLYQNVYTKSLDINDVRRIIKCDGYVEGWATYVEIESYNYAKAYSGAPALKLASKYLALNNQYSLVVNALFDLCIHYKGMNLDELVQYLNKLLGRDFTNDDLESSYYQICEIPTNMSMYAISFFILDEIKVYAQNELGEHFDIVDFNKTILDMGAAPLEMVIDEIYEYVDDCKFIYQINK